jgi:hypothetical protein
MEQALNGEAATDADQYEFNVAPHDPAAVAAAMAAAMAAATETSGAADVPPDAATKAAAHGKATQLLKELGPEGGEGLRDLHNFSLSMGLPAARALFTAMAKEAGCLRGKALAQALHDIEGVSPVTEKGCMRVDFYNSQTRAADTAYILVDGCRADHNFGNELDRLKPLVAADKWAEVLKSISALIQMVRMVYSRLAIEHAPLIRRLTKTHDTDGCSQYQMLHVDPANTTLYVLKEWTHRAGVYVRFDGDRAK